MLRILTATLLFSGAYALTANSGRNTSSVDSNGDNYLYASDFSAGTYRITKPGKYLLYQDVEFEPRGPGVTETLFPDKDSKAYPQLAGYFLGFFAAITVEADDVEIDCKGHEIKMSEKFWKHQRFFATIELGSKPFISGQGPPQFSSYITTQGAVKSANNVIISNCKLGRSSHHGIHGNDNRGVTLRNIQVYDFEVGGVALNGATDVHIEDADIGPSLDRAFSAFLSQTIFLDHLANTLLPTHPDLRQYVQTTFVTLRGERKTVKSVFGELRQELEAYLSSGQGALQPLIGDGQRLPDGSAMYGVMLHKQGVAIGDFGAGCALGDNPDEKMVGPVILKNIRVHDLKIDVDQWTRTVIGDGPQLMGPAGDVFPLTKVWNKDTFEYVGNHLSDAQLAMGALKEAAASWKAVTPITWEDAKYFFGALNLPTAIQDWAAGSMSSSEVQAWKNSLVKEGAFKCDGDAMTHINKGVVGVRLEFQDGVKVENVKVEGLINIGKEDAKWCKCSGYKGNDIRGVALVHVKNIDEKGFNVVADSLNAPNGAATPIAMLQVPTAVPPAEQERMFDLGLLTHSVPQHPVRRLRQAPMAM